MTRTPANAVRNWLASHVRHDGEECLKFPYLRTRNGYGVVWDKGVRRVASRVMCEMAHGAPPSTSYDAAHSCGNGHLGCVNPSHLRWASKQENSADMRRHGVAPIREKHGRAKLTETDVEAMRLAILSRAATQRELARMYNVHPSTVSLAVRGVNWSKDRSPGKPSLRTCV